MLARPSCLIALTITATVSLAGAQEPLPPPPAPPPGPPPTAVQPAPPTATGTPTQPAPPPAATGTPTQPTPPLAATGRPPQPPVAPYAPPGYWGPVATVPVDLTTSTPGAGFEVYYEGSDGAYDALLASCKSSCRVYVHPGTYKFQITETEDTLGGDRVLEVSGPMSIDFDPDTHAKQTTGLVLGLAGPVMIVAGAALVLSSIDMHEEYGESKYESDDDDDTTAGLGVLMVIGGLAATPIGWVMYGTSFKPEYEIRPALGSTPAPVAAPSPKWTIGPTVTGSGLGLAGTATF